MLTGQQFPAESDLVTTLKAIDDQLKKVTWEYSHLRVIVMTYKYF